MSHFDLPEHFTDGPGITLSRAQLEAWAGRNLTEDEVDRIDAAIPFSSIPEAIGVIADSIQEATS
jgi:hypothetical protein